MTELTQFQKVIATFTPKRTDDLTPEARAAIGKRATWRAYFVIEGPIYDGQWAMVTHEYDIGWVPFCDLSDVEEIK